MCSALRQHHLQLGQLCLCLCSCDHRGSCCLEQRGCKSPKPPVDPEKTTVVAMPWSWLLSARKKLKYQTCLNFFSSLLWVSFELGLVWYSLVCAQGVFTLNCAGVVQDRLASVANMVWELVLVSQPCPTTTNAHNHKGKEVVVVSVPPGYKDTNRHN